eukprot:scaffold13735_cov99-Isochrysis_galbana.AAC.4
MCNPKIWEWGREWRRQALRRASRLRQTSGDSDGGWKLEAPAPACRHPCVRGWGCVHGGGVLGFDCTVSTVRPDLSDFPRGQINRGCMAGRRDVGGQGGDP